MKIVSAILILVTVYLNLKHGWSGLSGRMSEAEAKLMADMGLDQTMVTVISVMGLATADLTLIPGTFFAGNILNAIGILLVMSFALRAGNVKVALSEIPFLLLPLVLIWLGYPLAKK